jgi:hypothetical protein
MYEVEGMRRDLLLERRAHRETKRFLHRMIATAQYYYRYVRHLEDGDPKPEPIPAAINAPYVGGIGDGIGGGIYGVTPGYGGGGIDGDTRVSGELVLATVACLARLGEQLMSDDPLPLDPAPSALLQVARHRLDVLAIVLAAQPRWQGEVAPVGAGGPRGAPNPEGPPSPERGADVQ